MIEIPQKRTYNSKHFSNGDGTYTAKVHAGHIHYKDVNGVFQDSDIRFVDRGTYWEMKKHNYSLFIAKDFGAEQLIRFDNKFEGASHSIIYEPHSIVWHDAVTNDVQVFRDQQSVIGELVGDNLIRYTNAFGAGIDFEITLMRSGFKKEIIIRNKPASLPVAPGTGYKMHALFKYTGNGLKVKNKAGVEWNKNIFFTDEEGFEIVEELQPLAKSFIQKAYAVDSTPVTPKRVSLKVAWFLKNGALWQAKEIPLEKLTQATFPVRLDTVTSYYGSAGDGVIFSQSNTTWNNVRNNGSSANYTDTTMEARIYFVSGSTYSGISRSYPIFDTSGLTADATISAAVLKMYLTWNGYSGSPNWDGAATITTITRDSTSTLSTADYPLTRLGSTKLANSLTYAQRTQDTYNSYTLNASGLAVINKTGYTAFAYRQDKDIDNQAVGGGGYSYIIPQHATSEDTSGTKDPYLEVTYTLPPSGGTETADRDAEISGQAVSTASREAVVHGIDTANASREAELHGSENANTDRSAELTGQITTGMSRSAEVHGIDSSVAVRSAEVHGQDSTQTDRDAEVTGQDTETASRGAETHGHASGTASRNAEITGTVQSTRTVPAELTGRATEGETRDAEITGQDTESASRSAVLHGITSEMSTRDAETTGQDQSSADREAELSGIDTGVASRGAVLTGKENASTDRDAEVTGQIILTADRDGELHGINTTETSRSAEVTGCITSVASFGCTLEGKRSVQFVRKTYTLRSKNKAIDLVRKDEGLRASRKGSSLTLGADY